MKKALILFIIFIMINLLVARNGDTYPFYVLNSIMLPIYNYKIVFYNLCLSYFFIAIVIYFLIDKCNAIFELACFIYSRCNKTKLVILYLKALIKEILIILIVKLIADLLANSINGLTNISMLLKIYTSMFLSFIIWGEIIYILYIITKSEKKSLFGIAFIAFTSQFLALKYDILRITAITSFNFYKNSVFIFFYKVISICFLVIIMLILTKKNELIGEIKND